MSDINRVTHRAGFTLVEILIVTAIIGLLAAVGIPAFANARQKSMATKVARDIQVLADAVQVYAAETGAFPLDTPMATVPIGMQATHFKVDWSEETAAGGYWDFDASIPQCFNAPGAISIFGAGSASDSAIFLAIDDIIDDGNLGTGIFRASSDRYTYMLE